MSLYQLWLQIADQFSEDQALLDWKSGQSWTFQQIQQEVDKRESAGRGDLLFPRGCEIELIFETLRSWRDGAVLCPVEGDPPEEALFAGIPENIAHVKMTSGSAAEPKIILFTESQLAADAANIVESMGLKAEWPNLGVISMAHSYGFSNLVTPLLLHGIPLVWAGDPMPDLLSGILEREGVAYTLPAVPAMWRVWMEAGVISGEAIRLAISAGAPLSLELERRIFDESGLKVHNFYGSSECGGIAYDRSESPREDAAFVGTALVNVKLELREKDSCLVVHSEAVGQRYWPAEEEDNSSDAHQHAVRLGQGRYITEDLVDIDAADGKVYLRNRIGERINVAGRKVAPGKIEQAILASDHRIRHCLVFGVPSADEERVEDIVACVSTEEENWEETEVKAAIQHSLGSYEIPRRWWHCQDLEPDVRGKLSRMKWRESFLKQHRSR